MASCKWYRWGKGRKSQYKVRSTVHKAGKTRTCDIFPTGKNKIKLQCVESTRHGEFKALDLKFVRPKTPQALRNLKEAACFALQSSGIKFSKSI